MILEYTKKSGGGISTTTLGVLLICVVICSSFSKVVFMKKKIHSSYQDNIVLHYIYLESLYYIRNEIYEETYYDMHYESDNVSVNIKINSFLKQADLNIKYKNLKIEKYYLFDTECLCITN